MYLHKNPKKQNGINYNYYSLAESYRDPKTKKTKTRTFRYLGNLTNKEIENWKLRLKLYNGDLSNVINIDEIKFIDDKNYLDVALFSFLYDLLGFDELFPASKRKKLNPDEVAKILIISRCLSPMANYKTSEWINKTYLPKIMSIDADLYNKDKIFDELANISSARVEIQKHLIGLSKKFNKDEFELYFFDGTTSFFEGECCLLGEPNKDKTNGYQEKVILILLVVDKRGYPVCWEVFCGRASEKIKIQELLTRFKKDFKIKEVTFCFDRGFSTKDNFSIISEQSGLRSKYISALNRNQFEKVFDVDAFTETTRSKLIEDYYFPEKKQNINKRITPINGFYRYGKDRYIRELSVVNDVRCVASFNINIYEKEQKVRNDNIKAAISEIENLNYELNFAKRDRDDDSLEKNINNILSKKRLTKIIDFKIVPKLIESGKSVQTYKIDYSINEKEKIEDEKKDGLLIYKTNHTEQEDGFFLVQTNNIVGIYREKYLIEHAFRHIKSFEELRPIHVYLEEHVKAHVDICMIAYFINSYIKNKIEEKYSLAEFHSLISDYSKTCILGNGFGSDIALIKMIPDKLKEIISMLGAEKILSQNTLKTLNLKLS